LLAVEGLEKDLIDRQVTEIDIERQQTRIAIPSSTQPQVAIVHDYITQRGGAERVVLALAKLFPTAEVHTSLYEPETTYPEFGTLAIKTSYINRYSTIRRNHRLALPLLAPVMSHTSVDADLVIASSSGWAHGIQTEGRKVVYCYSPARWLYQRDAYIGSEASKPKRAALLPLSPYLRRWDRNAAATADEYIAISSAVRERIRKAYKRDSVVIPAPHTMDASLPREEIPGLHFQGGFYLCVARLLPYKNVRAIVEAFRGSPDGLLVIGDGPDKASLLRDLPKNVRIVSGVNDAQMRWAYAQSVAVVCAGYEDFGLTPLEGACFGKPSVVLRWGGFLDTVEEGTTGTFFSAPTPDSIRAAIEESKSIAWRSETLRIHAKNYDVESFGVRLRGFLGLGPSQPIAEGPRSRSRVEDALNSHLRAS
jgi:glycosyltransferase involved in cell wall biosynthesis